MSDATRANEADGRGPWIDVAERYGLFLPIGLVASVARSVPASVDELADRGRAEVGHLVERIEMKVRTARVIGQFAAPRVRRVITDRVDQQRVARREAARAAARDAAVSEDVMSEDAVTEDVVSEATAPESPPEVEVEPFAPVPTVAAAPVLAGDAPAAAELPIDGYDQLGASQIVARLDGLGAAELESVRRYELAGRHRRTILTRIQQLSDGR
jgi:hypothetical protein